MVGRAWLEPSSQSHMLCRRACREFIWGFIVAQCLATLVSPGTFSLYGTILAMPVLTLWASLCPSPVFVCRVMAAKNLVMWSKSFTFSLDFCIPCGRNRLCPESQFKWLLTLSEIRWIKRFLFYWPNKGIVFTICVFLSHPRVNNKLPSGFRKRMCASRMYRVLIYQKPRINVV